ncbi:MAG: hypothetical protein D6805_00740 [Planctomycetota bacterium]|nr:MAG: hypothetical protein D6805_00740 [Planctomycetota bacterium]
MRKCHFGYACRVCIVWFLGFFFLPDVLAESDIEIYKFLVFPGDRTKHQLLEGQNEASVTVKWPEQADSMTVKVVWQATWRRVESKVYINDSEYHQSEKEDIRTIKESTSGQKVDEFVGVYKLRRRKKDFVFRVSLFRIGSEEKLASFQIKYIIPKPMSYRLRKSFEEIFRYHYTAFRAYKLFDKTRKARIRLIDEIRRGLTESQVEVAKLKAKIKRLKTALTEKYGEELKRMEAQIKALQKELAQKTKTIAQKNDVIIKKEARINELLAIIRDRTPPEILILFPKEKLGKRYVARSDKLKLQVAVRDESEVEWVKVGKEKVRLKPGVLDDNTTAVMKFSYLLEVHPGDNTITISARDVAGNQTVQNFIIVRKLAVIKEYLCDNCRTRIRKDFKYCPNCQIGPLTINMVKRRYICQGCDLCRDTHKHIEIVRKKEGVDKRPPDIQIQFPDPEKIYYTSKNAFAIRGTVEDNLRLDKVLIQGKPITLSQDRDEYGGKFVHKIALVEGKHTVVVQAFDKAGNSSKVELKVVVDTTKPEITYKATRTIVGKYIIDDEIVVSGKVKEANLFEILVNDKRATVDAKGNYRVKLRVSKKGKTVGPRKDILFPLIIQAKDMAGNVRELKRSLIYKVLIKGDDQLEENDKRTMPIEIEPGLYEGLICSSKDEDWFKITIRQLSILRVKIFFKNEEGDLDLKLYSLNKERAIAKSASNVDNEMLEKEVTPGVYLIRVLCYGKTKNKYDLFIKQIDIKQPVEGVTYLSRNSFGFHEYRHNKTGLILVLIPGGSFWMGTTETNPLKKPDELPTHEVYLDSYLIGKYEVRQKIWQKIMKYNPSYNKRNVNLPVEQVTWQDAMRFCLKTGLTLPTEAQWERACRAELNAVKRYVRNYFWGNKPDGQYFWYSGNANQSQIVGTRKPNSFGLYDMSGNVREWCWDWYAPYPKTPFVRNVRGPLTGTKKVNRGGGYASSAENCRSARRYKSLPILSSFMVGFRVCLPIKD